MVVHLCLLRNPYFWDECSPSGFESVYSSFQCHYINAAAILLKVYLMSAHASRILQLFSVGKQQKVYSSAYVWASDWKEVKIRVAVGFSPFDLLLSPPPTRFNSKFLLTELAYKLLILELIEICCQGRNRIKWFILHSFALRMRVEKKFLFSVFLPISLSPHFEDVTCSCYG